MLPFDATLATMLYSDIVAIKSSTVVSEVIDSTFLTPFEYTT